eukprot:CAMPEP_0119544092 /NCGR_PEP_ID=MMETSP1344-20130328/54532_1 /TAXON_ID=236787 /ORGANISM="Florenciella parvula, Strain CCMP2471" /LENGTH=31 /DNA_ID= /DNA_START= /DNA_END= /DNA_ORIENTATION=
MWLWMLRSLMAMPALVPVTSYRVTPPRHVAA